MGTLGDLKARIADELGTDGFASQVALAIDSAIRHYRATPLWFNESPLTVATVAGTASYALPAAWLAPALVTVTDGDREVDLTAVSWPTYRVLASSSRGRPFHYALWQEKLWPYPVPDQAYTLNLYATGALAALASDSSSNAWTTEAEELIRQRAKWDVFHNVLRDYDEANRAKVAEGEALRALRRETALRSPIRRVRASWL